MNLPKLSKAYKTQTSYRMSVASDFSHDNDIIMSAMASQITIVYSTVYSGTYERKHQGSASLAFVRGIHRSPVNSPHKGPVTRKMRPFDVVIMFSKLSVLYCNCIVLRRTFHCWTDYNFTGNWNDMEYAILELVTFYPTKLCSLLLKGKTLWPR